MDGASGALEAHGYCLIGALGRGSQGAVYTVRHVASGETYVLKRMHIMEPEARRTALLEAETLGRLQHTGVVGYRDTFVDDEYLCLVMEHADGGDLGSKIAMHAMRPFSEEQILRWFAELALALHHVHERGVLHRDLKTQNVFISSAGHVKLGDFGIARSISESIPLAETCVGTPYYMPPELFRGEQYDAKADVWSLGCILYELATRRRAFQSPNLNSLSVKVMRGEHGPLPPSVSAGLHELIKSLLTVSTDRRPSLDTVLTTPILRRHIASYAEEMLCAVHRGAADWQPLPRHPACAALEHWLPQCAASAARCGAVRVRVRVRRRRRRRRSQHRQPSTAAAAAAVAAPTAAPAADAPYYDADGAVRVEGALRRLEQERKWRQRERLARRAGGAGSGREGRAAREERDEREGRDRRESRDSSSGGSSSSRSPGRRQHQQHHHHHQHHQQQPQQQHHHQEELLPPRSGGHGRERPPPLQQQHHHHHQPPPEPAAAFYSSTPEWPSVDGDWAGDAFRLSRAQPCAAGALASRSHRARWPI